MITTTPAPDSGCVSAPASPFDESGQVNLPFVVLLVLLVILIFGVCG